jgi:hypothetical protein
MASESPLASLILYILVSVSTDCPEFMEDRLPLSFTGLVNLVDSLTFVSNFISSRVIGEKSFWDSYFNSPARESILFRGSFF